MNYTDKQEIEKALQDLTMTHDEILKQQLESIINKLPPVFKDLIEQSFNYKRVPKEYLLSAIMFTISSSIGLTFFIKALGYKNYANCYFTIVGSRGDAKSEAIKIATAPIKNLDDKDYDKYLVEKSVETEGESSTKRKQVLLQNSTIEAAQKAHSDNPNSIGLCVDEMYGLIEKIGNSNSRDGIAWRNFFLEGYTNGHIDISRKTTESYRIKETYPTLIGGLQHQFVPKLFANGNLESGFIDRLLFTTLITKNNRLILGEINIETIENYDKAIQNILNYKRQSELPDESIKQFEIEQTEKASKMIFDYTQELINRKTEAPPMIKEYIAKMQITLPKLCINVFMMRNASETTFANKLTEADVELAIELNEFYFQNFKKIIDDNLNGREKTVSPDDVIKMGIMNNASQKAVAEVTGLHKGTVSKKYNQQTKATGN